MIEAALKKTNSLESRQRKLTSSLVVCLVIAMSYWSSDSMTTVLKNLVNGLNKQWTLLGQSWKMPVSSSITEARQRLGCQVMSQLFYSIVKPLANQKTPLLVGLIASANQRKKERLIPILEKNALI